MNERLNKFDNFVKTINLDGYRKKYSQIKIVEMDLPRNIQALKTIYKYYWSDINIDNIPDFEKYYDLYYGELKDDIEQFRIKTEMCKECFNKGLKARIYRTWASIITQIHAGYVAEDVFGNSSIDMNDELDHAGKDFVITYNSKTVPIQIKKESKRPESRILRQSSKNNGFIVNIKYCVPNANDFKNPRYKKTNEIKPQMLDFIAFSQDGILDRYQNGFVVFTDKVFKDIQNTYF
jgi:hypothetical protein